jgi:hypothetical protein
MRLPNLEEERQGIYRAAIAAILGALGRDEMDDDAAAALWTLVHTYLPYRIERPDEVDVEWREEDTTMVQQLDQKWLADIRAQGELEGALRAKRAWLKEDIARRFWALPPEVAARIDGVESEEAEIVGLLDTGAAANVLPYPVSVTPGAVWDQQTTVLSLAGNLERVEARAPVLLGLSKILL